MKSVVLLFVFIGSCCFAAGQNSESLEKTAAGKGVISYFTAFNSGSDEKLRDFFQQNLTETALIQRAVEPRLAFHKLLREEHKTLSIKKILLLTDTEIQLYATGETGNWVKYTFEFEQKTGKFSGWQIERAESPQEIVSFPAPKNKDELKSAIEQYMNNLVTQDKFSGVVLVAHSDKPIFQKAYGYADRDKKTLNNIGTKFNLGSINKSFTRIAIGQLVEKGLISFEDHLAKFLPDYPNKAAAQKVTIGHLVTMKSGIGDFFGEDFENTPKEKLRQNADFIPLFAGKPLAFEPGTKTQYSNGGYILLGAIIEKISGLNYFDYVKKNIFAAASMNDTDSFEIDKLPENTARGYTRRNASEKLQSNFILQPWRGSAAGGGYSNASDLLKFSIALKQGILKLPDDNGKAKEEISLGIAGGSPGVNGMLIVNAQNGYTIIVLSNYDPPSAERPGEQILDWVKQITK